MRKKLLSLALALAVCLGLTVPALAADSDFVIENGVLTKYNGSGGDVIIPSGVTSIGQNAFAYKNNLTSVTIPGGVTSIGTGAFRNCENLTRVTIPDSVTTIDDTAFYYCKKLNGLTIPDGVTTIGPSAFELCESLTSLTIPASVTSITRNPFEWCESLTAIHVSSGNQAYTDRDGVLFSKDMTTLIGYPTGNQGPYVIPDSVVTIGDHAFAFCKGLTGVTIPNSVTTIGESAFRNCENLTSLTIPDSVTTIKGAFFACHGLTSVTISSSVTDLGGSIFSNCSGLTSVTIPDGVTTIGRHAFFNCESLTSITIPASVTKVLDSAFGYSFGIGLTDVYYGGSEAQWNAVTVENGNDALKNATIHYSSAGPQKPAEPSAPAVPAVSTVGGFSDVKTGDYFADPVLWAVEKGITAGTSATAFSPNADCSTAQILTFLWRANGSPKPTTANPFTDVKSGDYFADAAAWAYEKGLVSGSAFSGNTPCTRSMAVTYMWKAAGSPSAGAASFTDVPADAEYAGAVAWAVEQGVTAGTSASAFSPDKVCTRGQIVTFLYRGLAE